MIGLAIRGINRQYEGQNFEVHVGLDGTVIADNAAEFDRDFARPFPRRARAGSISITLPGWVETPIYERLRLSAGGEIAGLAIIEEMSATALLHPGQHAIVDPAGNLIVSVRLG